MRKKVIATVSLCFLALVAAKAQNPTKTYLLLANGQGPGSTSFASAFSSSVIAHYDALGVVSRNRAIRISQLKQPLCQACNPSRRTRSCNGFRRTKPSSRPTTSLTIRPCLLLMHPPCLPANQESFSSAQWNLHQIHADQTATNGDRGKGRINALAALQ